MTAPQPINLPSEAQLRAQAQARFADIRRQQELDRQAAQTQAQEVFGEGALGRVEEGRSAEIADVLQQRRAQQAEGGQALSDALARRQETISTGGQDPAFRQIEESARRAQDIQTQTSLRQLRGELGAQGVRGGINLQRQLQTLGGGAQAEANLQAQLAQARLQRVGQAEQAAEGLIRSRIGQQAESLGATEQSLLRARADEAQRAETNVQRALQERLGRLQLVESRAQAGTLERAAASREVAANAQLAAQIQQQNIANQIAFQEANKEPPKQGKVLCTEMHRQGLISDEVFAGDLEYAKSVSIETKIGYWLWAKPLAEKCSKSKVLTTISLPFVKAWATEMAYRVGYVEKGSFLGKIMTKTFEPACNLLGKLVIKCGTFNLGNYIK